MDVSLFAVKCEPSPGAFTLGGNLLVHDNREELAFLFPGREILDVTGTDYPIMWWKDHLGMAAVEWPLKREDFR